jgi:7-carboxy-7-deazaguanine synthase
VRPLLLSEEFLTVQGEGRFTGAPSYFIRTSGCNLRCWWCDTPYTSHSPEGNLTSLDPLIERTLASGARHVVITGGEPMLFPEQVAYLIDRLRAHGVISTVETNGTIYDERVRPDLWSVSPKLPSAEPTQAQFPASALATHRRNHTEAAIPRLVEEAMKPTYAMVQFKFVVVTPADVEEVLNFRQRHGIPDSLVWLMPEGRTREEVIEKSPWVVEECKRHGFNFCMRVHTLIWGAKRGV